MAYISFQPQDYFNTKLYTGNTAGQSITGIGFKPDFSWFKGRVGGGFDHSLRDVLRGSLKHISSNSTAAESDSANSVSSFDTDGFTLGTDNRSFVNENGTTYVSWNWRANGAGSANSDGSITTTYTSANTTSGFSISTYTGTGSAGTIGHGLGVAPAMIMAKRLTGSAEAWVVYHQSLGGGTTPQDKYLHLNSTDAEGDSAGMWNDTAPTTSVFSVGSTGVSNGSGGTFVAYCFAEKKGFSKFGSYTGNGNADGPLLFCGFKPAFILLKNASDAAKNWEMLDNKRPSTGQNPADDILFPDTADAESSSQTDRLVDFVSNGVKIRGNSAQMNGSGNTFIYMAFAEHPLVASNGTPATAR